MDVLLSKSDTLKRKYGSMPLRGLFSRIEWSSRLIGIKGARGVGKTTLLLQRLHDLQLPVNQALFISLDDWYFTQHTLLETAETFAKKGGKYLFIDEVHKYPNWAVQIKNLYDFTELNIIFTGSSIMDIAKEQGDLSRRAVMYTMQGLSFREYLTIEYNMELPTLTMDELTEYPSENFLDQFPEKFNPYQYFDEYLKWGYYPIYKEGKSVFSTKIQQMVRHVIENDMASLKNFEVRNAKKILQLLGVISQNVPFKPNIQKLAEKMEINRITLGNYLIYLQEAQLVELLYPTNHSIASLQKPEKIYFENTNLSFALSGLTHQNEDTLRETFVMNQLKQNNKINSTPNGDFIINDKITFEVGGKNKTSKQIKHQENSFRVLDDYTFTSQKEIIPIWLLGFLY
jgi:predicted AAA+ superfamily ATPase